MLLEKRYTSLSCIQTLFSFQNQNDEEMQKMQKMQEEDDLLKQKNIETYNKIKSEINQINDSINRIKQRTGK